MKKTTRPRTMKFPAAKQRRLDELLDKNSEGTISARESAVLNRLVAEAERLMAANAKRLSTLTQKGRARPSAGAVPVTVWVQPNHAGH